MPLNNSDDSRWFNWLTVMLILFMPKIGADVLSVNSSLWWILPNIPLIFLLVATLTPQGTFKPLQAMGLVSGFILLCAISFFLREKSLNAHVTYPQLFCAFLVMCIAYLIGSRNTAIIEWGTGEQHKSALKSHLTALFVALLSSSFWGFADNIMALVQLRDCIG